MEWNFPPRYVIYEDVRFGTDFCIDYTETKDLNVSVSRWMNETTFGSDAYQLAEFNVTFENIDFLWWGHIRANRHWEVEASIVPGSFETNAPLDWVDEWEHGIHFVFDREQIETNVTYSFSVIIKVELTDSVAPPILYKPLFYLGERTYYEGILGEEGFTAEMPEDMLPEHVYNASVSTNVSNQWVLKRHNHIITGLKEVVKLVGPHAEFHFNKDFVVWTRNDTIASGTHECNKWYWMHIENVKDTSGTTLSNLSFSARADDITDVDWNEYAEWNETSVEWNYPSDFVIYEDEGFGTGFGRGSEIIDVNLSLSRWMNITEFNSNGYQLAKFNVTFDDTNFEWVWGRIEANERHEIEASIVPGTFTYDAPLRDFDEWDHGIHFDFDKEQIQIGVPYNFSVLIQVELTGKEAPPILYKPQFTIGEGFYYNSTIEEGDKIEVPTEMLPEQVYNASASTNVSNAWLIKRHNHIIAGLEEVSGSTRIEAGIFGVYMITLPAMPNATFSEGPHENYKFSGSWLESPTSTSIPSLSMLLETQKPVMHYETAGVDKFSYDFVSENSSMFNWSLYNIPPHKEAGSMVILSEMALKDHGYSATVSVDKFEFFTHSEEQNLNITVDVYDNSSMEKLRIAAFSFDEHTVKSHDFVSAEFVGWSSDIIPAHFTADHAVWAIQNPNEKEYTFSVKVNVTPYSPCVYKPGVRVIKLDFIDERLVNSSSSIAETTWVGNYTISIDEARDWIVYKVKASVSNFRMIAAENYTTISGYVKDDDENPIGNVGVFVSIWNGSEYQDYVGTSTNESGYYEAYVKGTEKYKIVAGWTRPDYTTEVVENVTSLPFTKNFTLFNASVVCGGVFSPSKKPMPGVMVMVVNESNITISSDWTNDDGYYRQLKIPEYGNYTVKVEGYDSNDLELSDIGKGKAILHNFVVELPPIFDTGPSKNPYPSIMGTHEGKIIPSRNINVSRLYTYPCAGTGGHSEYMKIWNETWEIETMPWEGYKGDWHTLSFPSTFTLVAGETYNYTIRTGSYPQIIHNQTFTNDYGTITCSKFTDVNGRVYHDWIPAIMLE